MVTLKGQDVLVLLKLSLMGDGAWTYPQLAQSVGLSISETHAAVQRGVAAGLVNPDTLSPVRRNLIEFLEHGVKYVFIPRKAGLARGVPTAHAAPPLRDSIASSGDPPPVWPHPDGDTRGEAIEPLYPSAVKASLADRTLYECLALVDALRIGRARERKLAAELLEQRLSANQASA